MYSTEYERFFSKLVWTHWSWKWWNLRDYHHFRICLWKEIWGGIRAHQFSRLSDTWTEMSSSCICSPVWGLEAIGRSDREKEWKRGTAGSGSSCLALSFCGNHHSAPFVWKEAGKTTLWLAAAIIIIIMMKLSYSQPKLRLDNVNHFWWPCCSLFIAAGVCCENFAANPS